MVATRKAVVATAILVILFIMDPLAQDAKVIKADSNEPMTFSSGLTVYSPVNTVYNSYSVPCNVTLRVPYAYQSGIVYYIDGIEQNDSTVKFNVGVGPSGKYIVQGVFMLPPLHNGPHQLTFHVQIELFNYSGPPPSSDFKAGVTSYGVKYYEADYENTILFTIYSNEPFPTPTQTPKPSPIANPTATATIPEFPTTIAVTLVVSVILAAAFTSRKRKLQQVRR